MEQNKLSVEKNLILHFIIINNKILVLNINACGSKALYIKTKSSLAYKENKKTHSCCFKYFFPIFSVTVAWQEDWMSCKMV